MSSLEANHPPRTTLYTYSDDTLLQNLPKAPDHDPYDNALNQVALQALSPLSIPLPTYHEASNAQTFSLAEELQTKELAACEAAHISKSSCHSLIEQICCADGLEKEAQKLLLNYQTADAKERLKQIRFSEASNQTLLLKAAMYEQLNKEGIAHFLLEQTQNKLGTYFVDAIEKAKNALIDKIASKGTDITDCQELELLAKKYSPIELFEEKAKKGDPSALCLLGRCYDYGICVEKNIKTAFSLYEQSAKKDNADALQILGKCYQRGISVKEDLKKAVLLYENSAKKGSSYALCNLGFCYYEGIGVKKNHKTAFQLWTKAAEKENSIGLSSLAFCHHYGVGVTRNSQTSAHLYNEAAERGSYIALINLGNCYVQGSGVKRDLNKALQYFLTAGEKGFNEGIVRLRDLMKKAIDGDRELKPIFKENPELFTRIGKLII